MPTREITELRKAGKLEEALLMARTELNEALEKLIVTNTETEEQENHSAELIWPKRNLSWVLYSYLQANLEVASFEEAIKRIGEIRELQLPADEVMFYESLAWQLGKMAFNLARMEPAEVGKGIQLFDSIKSLPFPKPAASYSFLFKGLHKLLKESARYLEFSEWWGLENLSPENYKKEELPNGKFVMSLAEQAYISYAKKLLPWRTSFGEEVFNKEKALAFIPRLTNLSEKHPDYQYPAYFQARLLLAVGDKENLLGALLPFARKKRNDFWVWDILAEAFQDDPEKVLACYCRGLSCTSPEMMIVNLREKMASVLIARNLYSEAKTEIEHLLKARNEMGYPIPGRVNKWLKDSWYSSAISGQSNEGFYKQHLALADQVLFSDIQEEKVIVEFVKEERRILNFIASDNVHGFFKYDRFITKVKVGTVLMVRFQEGKPGDYYKVFTVRPIIDELFRQNFVAEVTGTVRIKEGSPFGFVNDVFISPTLIKSLNITNGSEIKGLAIKSFNPEKKKWGWRMIS